MLIFYRTDCVCLSIKAACYVCFFNSFIIFRKMNEAKAHEEFPKEKVDKMIASRFALREFVLNNAQQGDIKNIIDTIDKFAWTQQWLMNVGDRKGEILDQAVRTRKPKIVLELGKNFFLLDRKKITFVF